MKALGCDIGSVFSKAVVTDGEKILAQEIMATTGNIAGEISVLIERVCDKAGIDLSDLAGIVATGRGADLVRNADFVEDEVVCIGYASRFFIPDIELVVDIGGQSITSMLLGRDGDVIDFMRNDKCATGSGRFLEVMAAALDIPVDRIDQEAAGARKSVPISSQCGVFVESEVITHVNNGESPQDIVAGLCDAVSRIVISQARRFGAGKRYTFTGGMARVRTIIDLANERMQGEYKPLPLDPMLIAALGAALMVEAS